MLHFDKDQVAYFAGNGGGNRRDRLRARYLGLWPDEQSRPEIEAWFATNIEAAARVSKVKDDEILFLLEIGRLGDTPLSRRCAAFARCLDQPNWSMRYLWLKGQLELLDPDNPALHPV